MDLYVEKQCIDLMKQGELRQFILLFDACFGDLYKYIIRRIGQGKEADEIVKLTFLDALGQVQNTPTDIGYVVWLYSLARLRVWERISRASFPKQQGVIVGRPKEGEGDLMEKADKMIGKLSLEEREILRLKFFEEVTDGDVMTVLGVEEGTIGPRIYRVLKRAHFLLFGEGDEKKGAYFGELSGLLANVRDSENIAVPEALKLNLKADLMKRIERRDFAFEAEPVDEKKDMPFEEKGEGKDFFSEQKNLSKDPAKIFVEAVREMREEEQKDFERREQIMAFFDRWKHVIVALPLVIFMTVVGTVIYNMAGLGLVERGYPSKCGAEVEFDGDFADGIKRDFVEKAANRLCDHFEEKDMLISRAETGVGVEFSIDGWSMEYLFAKKGTAWRIKKYERTPDSD